MRLYATSLAGIPDGQAKTDGISVGQAAALGIDRDPLERRSQRAARRLRRARPRRRRPLAGRAAGHGGTDALGGVHAPVPAPQRVAVPARAAPGSEQRSFKRDLAETQAFGAKASTAHTTLARTQAQTDTAYFWNANVINQYSQALRDVATQHGMDLSDTTRLLAMGTLVVTDAGIACFDAKYTYLFWRPVHGDPQRCRSRLAATR